MTAHTGRPSIFFGTAVVRASYPSKRLKSRKVIVVAFDRHERDSGVTTNTILETLNSDVNVSSGSYSMEFLRFHPATGPDQQYAIYLIRFKDGFRSADPACRNLASAFDTKPLTSLGRTRTRPYTLTEFGTTFS